MRPPCCRQGNEAAQRGSSCEEKEQPRQPCPNQKFSLTELRLAGRHSSSYVAVTRRRGLRLQEPLNPGGLRADQHQVGDDRGLRFESCNSYILAESN